MKSLFLILMPILFFIGCTTKYAYRLDPKICTYNKFGDCNSSFQQILKNSNCYLGIIEIDDQGLFHSNEQLNTVLSTIKRRGDNQDIIVYIHGWNHNAKEGDSNLKEFRKVLSSLSNRKNNNGEWWSYIFPSSNLKLSHIKNSSAYNPYWVIQAHESVIPNHNDILQENFHCFIREILADY